MVDNSSEAHLIKGRLKNEGIECMITNEISSSLLPHYNQTMSAGIQILVFENDLEKAQGIIKDKLEPEVNITSCPYCQSSNITLGIGSFRGIKILNIIIAILFMLPLGNLKAKVYCNDCKKELG